MGRSHAYTARMIRKIIITTLLASILAVAGYLIWSRLLRQEVSQNLPSPSLKALAESKGLELGNFAMAPYLDDQRYTDILTSQFNLALIDNTPNWYFTDGGLRPGPDEYDFEQMDRIVSFAQAHGMAIQAHHFVWGEEKWLPDWLKDGGYSRDELLGLIQDHISAVGERYRGRIQQWTVVNEAFTRGRHLNGLSDWWADSIGDQSYIDESFRWARQADPNATLILNDFGNESINEVSDAMYAYIKEAKARGVPIDGIGMQMHIDGTHPPTKDEALANMNRFGELGVDVYVTEFDVNMNDVPAEGDDKDQMQGRIYYEMLRACIESDTCKSFAYLGITDRETWYAHLGLPDPRPLMFDKDYQPKPAFWSTRDALTQP